MRPHRIPWLIISALVFSCSYQLEESTDPTVDLKQDQSIPIISLSGYADDTIYITHATIFNYKIENIAAAKGIQGNIMYDDKLIGSVTSAEGVFSIGENYLFDGPHTLKITAVGSSGSGSLAEQLGYESKFATKTWTVIVNVAPL